MTSSSQNVFQYMQGNLREKMNEYADFIIGVACKDYSEYTKFCGIIEGFAIAEREIQY